MRNVIKKSIKVINKRIKGQEFIFDYMESDVTIGSEETSFVLRSKTHPNRTMRATIRKQKGKWHISTLSYVDPGFEFIDRMCSIIDSILSSYVEPEDYCIWRVGYLALEENTDYKNEGMIYPESMFKVWVDFNAISELETATFVNKCKKNGILSIMITPAPKALFEEYQGKTNSREAFILNDYIHSLAKNNEKDCKDIIMCFGKPWRIRENSSNYEDGFSKEEIY